MSTASSQLAIGAFTKETIANPRRAPAEAMVHGVALTKSVPMTKKLDADLLALARRHDRLWARWARAADDDPRVASWSGEAVELEMRVIATPAHTHAGVVAKRRVLRKAELFSPPSDEPIAALVDVIFRMDAERVAAAR